MLYLLIIAIFLFQTTDSVSVKEVPRISESLIAEYTTYFELEDYQFRGAEPLLKALNEAHFVALGELHNRERLGELTSALLYYLQPHGYNYFAIETGPYSAKKLQNLIGSTNETVSDFYSKYSSKLFDLYPIPFFLGEKDLHMLSTADSLGFDLWGLDQEFAYSYTYLIDELANLAGELLSDDQQKLHRKLTSRLYWWDRRKQIFSGFERSCRLKDDEQLQEYLRSFEDSTHPDIAIILDAFRTTLEIYCMAEQGKASSRVRINYFKENFDRHYNAALAEQPEPRVLLKMGSFHMGRQRSPLGLYDIGNHIHELADSLSQQSVHIRYLNRYYNGDDMIGRKGWESFAHFISVGRRDVWALTDLRPLRSLIAEGALLGSDFEIHEITNYDFIIIPPEDHIVEKHY